MIDKGRILPSKVLVKPIEQETKKGSIIIPTNVIKAKTFAGTVVITGEGTEALPRVVEVGDKILHSPHSFVSVEIEDVEYRLLNFQDILFIWRD